MGEFPHFAVAYYHEQKKELIRTAMTEASFEGLTSVFSKAGLNLNAEADIVVSPGLLSAAKKILDRQIELNPYEKLFSKHKDKAESEGLKRLNNFMQLVLPFYNEERNPTKAAY